MPGCDSGDAYQVEPFECIELARCRLGSTATLPLHRGVAVVAVLPLAAGGRWFGSGSDDVPRLLFASDVLHEAGAPVGFRAAVGATVRPDRLTSARRPLARLHRERCRPCCECMLIRFRGLVAIVDAVGATQEPHRLRGHDHSKIRAALRRHGSSTCRSRSRDPTFSPDALDRVLDAARSALGPRSARASSFPVWCRPRMVAPLARRTRSSRSSTIPMSRALFSSAPTQHFESVSKTMGFEFEFRCELLHTVSPPGPGRNRLVAIGRHMGAAARCTGGAFLPTPRHAGRSRSRLRRRRTAPSGLDVCAVPPRVRRDVHRPIDHDERLAAPARPEQERRRVAIEHSLDQWLGLQGAP